MRQNLGTPRCSITSSADPIIIFFFRFKMTTNQADSLMANRTKRTPTAASAPSSRTRARICGASSVSVLRWLYSIGTPWKRAVKPPNNLRMPIPQLPRSGEGWLGRSCGSDSLSQATLLVNNFGGGGETGPDHTRLTPSKSSGLAVVTNAIRNSE